MLNLQNCFQTLDNMPKKTKFFDWGGDVAQIETTGGRT